MKKILLILIILFTNIFSQDILITTQGTEFKGKLLEQDKEYVFFKSDGAQQSQKIPIRLIKEIRLGNGEIIDFGDDTAVIKNGYFIDKEESLKDGNKISLSTIGGSLIGLSGVLMYSNNQRTLEQKTIEEFIDKTKSNYDLSSLLLTVGGILIAIDN